MRRLALLLVVIGLVCLPAPWYLGWAAESTAPPAKTSQVYAAEPINLDDDADRKRVVDRHGHRVTLADYQLTAPYARDRYRAVNDTRRALEAAIANGSTTVTDPDVRADIEAIAADNTFVRDSEAGPQGYYRLSTDTTDSTLHMRADPVSLSAVATVVADQAPRYETLSTGEQETVDAILANASTEDPGYRPRVNDPYVDQLPTPIRKDGTLYSIYTHGHVDDFGPGFSGFVVGLGVAALGVVLVLAGAVVYVIDRVRGGS